MRSGGGRGVPLQISRAMKSRPARAASTLAGADGLLVEVHHDPDRALSDGAQSLRPEQFAAMMEQLRIIAQAVDRSL